MWRSSRLCRCIEAFPGVDHSLDSHTGHKRPTPASFLQRQSVNYRSSNGQLLDYFEFSVARKEVASGRGCAGVASLCLPQVERWRALLLAAATELETPINASPLFAQPVPPPSHPSLPLPCHLIPSAPPTKSSITPRHSQEAH